ncbi:hypothetical protein D921_02039 [Enterococcus faecalis F01966]|nr:hypothetical protein D921_02039 [Enterococcus faecalis F01966]
MLYYRCEAKLIEHETPKIPPIALGGIFLRCCDSALGLEATALVIY